MKILIKGSEGDTVTFYQRDFLPYMSRVAGFAQHDGPKPKGQYSDIEGSDENFFNNIFSD